jgi:hypothetical protein
MNTGTAIIWGIVIIIGTIVIEYLLNPYFNRLGLPKKIEEKPKEKSEEEIKKEEEFYREIWTAKKRKRLQSSSADKRS